MARINVNLNDVESGFELFPDGVFPVEIQETTKLKQSDAGPYIMVIAKCTDGEMEDKMIGWNCSLLPNALWNLKAMMEAAGIEWEEDGFDLEELFEAQLMIEVSSYEYPAGSDKYRNQVDGYHSIDQPLKEKK